MTTPLQHLHLLVAGDDAVEAGRLALDLVHAGIAAQAVADAQLALKQVQAWRRQGIWSVAVVTVQRDLAQTVLLWEGLAVVQPPPLFFAAVHASQLVVAQRYATAYGWTGLLQRPVDVAALSAHLAIQAGRLRPSAPAVRLGNLDTEPLLEVLTALVELPGGAATALVRLQSQGRTGQVAVLHGELVHAAVDGESGRHSLERMAVWRQGVFSIESAAFSGVATLSGPSLAMLAVAREYARRVQELLQGMPHPDSVYTVRWERVRPLPVVAEALLRRLASGMPLRAALVGEGDDELEALAALEMRIRRGAVVAAAADPALPSTSPTSRMARAEPASWAAVAPSAVVSEDRDGESQDAGLPRPHGRPRTNEYLAESVAQPAAGLAMSAEPPAPTVVYSETAVAAVALPLAARAVPAPGAGLAAPQAAVPQPAATQPAALPPAATLPPRVAAGAVSDWFSQAAAQEASATDDDRRQSLLAGLQASSRASRAYPVPEEFAEPDAAPLADENGDGGEEPAAGPETAARMAPTRTAAGARWLRWAGATVALAAVVASVLWWRAATPPETTPDAATVALRAAVAQWDGGDAEGARLALLDLSRDPSAAAEVWLHLAVLDIGARRFADGRRHLDRYLAQPAARHGAAARRLHQRVFVGQAGAVQP